MRYLLLICFFWGCASEEYASDEAAFTFQDLRVEEIAGRRAVVRFDTSVPTSCDLEWGLAEDVLDQIATDPDMAEGETAIDHDIALEDLSALTTYYLRARAKDQQGNTEYSETISFRTLSVDDIDPTDGKTNVALLDQGTVVSSVSSNWANGDNDSSFGIHNAFDGEMTSEWSSNGDGDTASVTIDFGAVRELSYFAYRSRMMTDGTSIISKVKVIANGQEVGVYETPDHRQRYVFEISPAVFTQQVTVEAVETTGGNTGAKEIQFFE